MKPYQAATFNEWLNAAHWGEDLVAWQPLPAAEVAEFWVSRISGVGPMLRALVDRYPRAFEREALAQHLDMAARGGTFGTYLSRLSAAGLIEKGGAGVRAAPALMERA